MKIDVKAGQLRRKQKVRNHAEHLVTTRFKPGAEWRGNPGGKPKIQQRMATMLLTELDKPAPKELSKAFGLRGTRTKYEVMVAATIHRAMTTGDPNTLMALHDLTEGKLANRNYNLSVEMQTYMDNPGFREFLAKQHKAYLRELGGDFDNATGTPTAPTLHYLRAAGTEAEAPADR